MRFSSARVTAQGVDPGLANCGIAVVDLSVEWTGGRWQLHRPEVRYHTRVVTTAKQPTDVRLREVGSEINRVSGEHLPDVFGWESVSNVRAGKEQRGQGASAQGDRIKEVAGMVRQQAIVVDAPGWAVMPATYRVQWFGRGNTTGKTKEDLRRRVETVCGIIGLSLDESEAIAIAVVVAGIELGKMVGAQRRG